MKFTMKQLFTYSIMLLLLGAVSVPVAAEQAEYKWESDSSDRVSKPIRVQRLRCEYRDQPLGIDHPAPRLSWTLESSVRGQKQTAYRVLVARSIQALQVDRGDLWDSGNVESSQSVNIVYAGDALFS